MSTTITCTTATGTVIELNDPTSGCKVLKGALGLDAPPVSNSISSYLSFDGGVLTKMRRQVRPIVLPLFLSNEIRVQTKVAEIAAALQGPSTITFSDGTITRQLRRVIYEAGLEGNRSREMAGPDWRKFPVSLLALDPWYYGPAESQTLSLGAVTGFDEAIDFDSVTAFDGGGTTAVTVVGDADIYPVFTITGPVDTLTIGSGGFAWQLAAPLTSSDTLVVDHRPTSRGPRKNNSAVDWSLLTEASRLFPVTVGMTAIIIGATGTTAATTVVMAWESRFLTP